MRRAFSAPEGRWNARLGLVGAATVALMTVVAVVPSQDSGPVASGAQVLDAQSQASTVRTGLTSSADAYRQAVQAASDLDGQLLLAREALHAAHTRAEQEQDAVGRLAAELYRTSLDGRLPGLGLSVHAGAGTTDMLHVQSLAEQLDRTRERQVARATHALAEVDRLTAAVEVVERRIAAARAQAAEVLADLRAQTAAVSPGVAGQLAGMTTAARVDPAQAAVDQEALGSWQAYLARLAAAGVTAPTAAELADPALLPPGLAPMRDATGEPVPGVAVGMVGGRPETILAAETMIAVSTAFAQLGKPYAPGRVGPDAYGCGGLTSAVWTQAGVAVPADVTGQWTGSSAVAANQLQIGDLVFSADLSGRWSDVGMWLGAGRVLSASAATGLVGVRGLAVGPFAAVRVTLPAPSTPNVEPQPTGRPATECGAALPGTAPVQPAWGGYANGRIPVSELCPIAPGHRLRCDAAAAYASMSAAYQLHFGAPLCVTDSYRSYTAQVDAHRRKPAMTAAPGTSNHGWALAVDLCGGIHVEGSAQFQWMVANAGRFGWEHPEWARPGAEKPEAWHWEFGRLADTTH